MNNPYGHYTRHNTTDRDDSIPDTSRARAILWKYYARVETKRAEKAEQERDEARAALGKVSPRHPAVPTELLYTGHEAASARPLTAREHLDAAWEAAHVPSDGIIPAGAAYLMRSNRTGRVVTPTGDWAAPADLPASETWGERRLLDPPAPSRPEGAEEIEAYMREMVASHPEDHYGELADHLASRGVRVVTEKEARHATDE